MPVYFQSLQWLNEYTGDPGGWMITSLTLDEEKSENQVDCYTLWAHTLDYQNELTADLFFPYESEPTRPRIYGNLYFEGYHTSPGERDG